MEGLGALLVLGAAVLLGVECKAPLETPTFGDIYHVTGVISLPYAEIREPFEAWYNLTGGKSRIEYYGGQVVTYQFGSIEPFGASFKVTPETTETEVNVRKCFRINGTDRDLIAPQSVFPSLENFKRVREERFRGQRCAVWQNVSYWGHKKNVYTLRVGSSARGPVPLHYEVRGFNSLLGSHYDKYEIEYFSFGHRFPPSVFHLPKGMQCEQWPVAGPEHRIVANPMQEFVGRAPETDHVHHHLFHHYKERFGKSYSSEEEHEHRKRTFIHNMRELYSGLILPESLDWRMYGAVTPVKDQAVCGSCWSFATAGAMEGALFLKTGVLTPLSQQVLIDCAWGFGNYGCDGGEEWRAYEWIKKHGGIATTESYGPYLGQNGYCHCNQSELVAQLAGYASVEPGSAAALKAALVKHGPVAVNIDASHKSFAFYANGVYEEPHC
ncbi:hypothetical protein Q9233_012521, partial [Columba guinea]